jgi:predicted  nucleic acid-binding Zn-ribbon protein
MSAAVLSADVLNAVPSPTHPLSTKPSEDFITRAHSLKQREEADGARNDVFRSQEAMRALKHEHAQDRDSWAKQLQAKGQDSQWWKADYNNISQQFKDEREISTRLRTERNMYRQQIVHLPLINSQIPAKVEPTEIAASHTANKKTIRNLEKKVKRLETENQSLRRETRNLRKQFNATSRTASSEEAMAIEKEQAFDQAQALEHRLTEKEVEVLELGESLLNLRMALENVHSEMEKVRHKASQQYNELKKQLTNYQNQFTQLQAHHSSCQDIHEQANRSQQEIVTLRQQLSYSQDQYNQKVQELEDLVLEANTCIGDKNTEINSLRSQVQTLQSSTSTSSSEVTTIMPDIQELYPMCDTILQLPDLIRSDRGIFMKCRTDLDAEVESSKQEKHKTVVEAADVKDRRICSDSVVDRAIITLCREFPDCPSPAQLPDAINKMKVYFHNQIATLKAEIESLKQVSQ